MRSDDRTLMLTAAVVGFRYGLFDDVLDPDVLARQRGVTDAAATVVARFVRVEMALTVESQEEAQLIAAQLHHIGVDLIVAVPATAVPPAWVATALPIELPVVLWDVTEGSSLPPSTDQARAHRDTATVGTIMAGSALFHTHRFLVVSSPIEASDQDLVRAAVTAAAAASRLMRSTILRIGRSLTGYTSIPDRADAEEYEAVGATVVDVTEDQLLGAFAQHLNSVTADTAERSRALDQAIHALCDENMANAVAMNCHGPWVARADGIGIVGCQAATSCNSRGVPAACTADVPTAFVLRVAQQLAGSALYCEPYVRDDARECVLLANCGMGHPDMAAAGTWRELPNQQYIGVHGRGQSVGMTVHAGPATFLCVRPGVIRWSIVAIEGTVSPDRLDSFGGAHAFFSPTRLSPQQMIVALAERGVVHHGALAPGHHAEQLRLLERLLPLDVEVL